MKSESSFPGLHRFLKCLLAIVWLGCISHTALAAQNTAKEKANIQLVQDFYAALDAALAKGNMKEAIVGIAEKYIAPNYTQHAFDGKNGRDAFIRMAQSSSPPAAPAGAPPPMLPAKLVALMADGDLVIQVTDHGTGPIWNMFRIENGQLAEHWDAGIAAAAPSARAQPPK